MKQFIKSYIKSMRLYYVFVTGIPGWLGLSFYEHIARNFATGEVVPAGRKKFVILFLLFISWGVNQIINDYLGLEEDKINAPERPMVTGELPADKSLAVSFSLIVLSGLIIWFYLEPLALLPFILGIGLNVVYEFAKGYGIWGNITFGLMITMCPIFGFLAAGPIGPPYFTSSRVSVLLLVWVINGLMTFYTYFKDYKGDKRAGKETIVVKYGLRKSRVIGVIASLVPTILFVIIYSNDLIMARVNHIFLILGVLTFFLQVWTGVLYYLNPVGERTYFSLVTNFRACVCAQITLIALFDQQFAMILYLVTYVFIGFLFDLYQNSKA